ncbi:hypothetical protein JST97_27090 [bacterium]|nr:hypothetical protein [bacterium]
MGGGRGHATRSRRLGGLFGSRARVHYLLPERLRLWAQGLEASFCNQENLADSVSRLLAEYEPDLLVVDTFPRGLLGELAELEFPCPAWLIARWVKPEYAMRSDVLDALTRYEAVLGCERNPWQARSLGPVVGPVQTPRPCSWLWLGSGPLDQQRSMAEWLASRALLVAPDLGLERSDLPSLLAGAELVISAAGYNSYQEIVQAGVPVIFWPQERLYDEQWRRAQGELGPGPRGWWRCVSDQAGLMQALEDFQRQRPEPCGPLVAANEWARLLGQVGA